MSIKPYSDTDLCTRLKNVEAKLVEVRLDGCAPIGLKALKSLEQPLLLTSGTTELSRLEELASVEPAIIDIPHPCSPETIECLKKAFPSLKLMVSHHDHVMTPDLDFLLEQMHLSKADYYKIATTAHSGLDALKVMDFQKRAGANVVAIAMGVDGESSRVAGPVLGAPWTYAALEEGAETAPGQLTVQELRQIYHFDSLSETTSLFALFGDPSNTSPGHVAHNAVYRKSGIDALYLRFRITSEELEEALSLAKKLGFQGLSITMPHKEEVMLHLDLIEKEAAEIGAVNTLSFEEGRFVGSNSDGTGALNTLGEVKGLKIAILGAGGAARAIGYEASKRGAEVAYYSRHSRNINAQPFDALVAGSYDILVNATPVQMPIKQEQVSEGSVVMEIKTSPHETELLICAKEKGCRLIHGWEMYTQQAAIQMERWFNPTAL